MTDKPKCPSAVYVEMSTRGRILGTWSTKPPPQSQEWVRCGYSTLVEYIPRHSIDALLDACMETLRSERPEEYHTANVCEIALNAMRAALKEFRPNA